MYIAYSAFKSSTDDHRFTTDDPLTQARYRGYQQACKKHRDSIAQIQKYLPGWFPKFDYNTKY